MYLIYTLKRYKKKKNNNKFLLLIIAILVTLIILKGNYNLKEKFKKIVYESNINFSKINNLYQKYFGSFFNNEETVEVFKENLDYEEKKDYKEGVMLSVNKDYIVKAQNSGIVVFIGEKEGYGNSVIIQQVDGVDLMYGNLENINISLYDYIKKDEIIGDVNGKLYLVYKKEGKIIDYEEYNKG